ncbi:unnamed protein product, partial [Didymodactylos carnosus]
ELLLEDWKSILVKQQQKSPTILCRNCGHFLGPLASLRKYNIFYTIIDPEFMNRILLDTENDKETTAKAFCGNCKKQIGGTQKLPAKAKINEIYSLQREKIKIKEIDENGADKYSNIKTWTALPFPIPDLDV